MYEKITEHGRLTADEALELWYTAPLAELGAAARRAKVEVSGQTVYFNRNIHVEPTNVCAFRCAFCSYRRTEGEEGAWYRTPDEIEAEVRRHADKPITEVHIVGGVHPSHDLAWYEGVIRRIKAVVPQAAIKAYTAVELRYIFEKEGISIEEGLLRLKNAGMEAIPGGGAEIFAPRVRQSICPEKCTGDEWLELHEAAHRLGISTNATMLYGHIETIEERIDHLIRLRELQDRTGGFSAFIPLKFRTKNNLLGQGMEETSLTEDMRTMALARLVLDNVPHIKAYWPMLGVEATEFALQFGADDIDGTIDDTTKIYSMAGAEEQRPRLSADECRALVARAGFFAVERDTFYNEIN